MIQFTDMELGEMLDDTTFNQEIWAHRRFNLQQRMIIERNVYVRSKLQVELQECTRMIDALNEEIVALITEHRKRGYDV